MSKEVQGATYLQPGVMATNPQRQPFASPRMLGLEPSKYSMYSQPSPAITADKLVLIKRKTLESDSQKEDPPLKPNNQNQINVVPSKFDNKFYDFGLSS